MMMSQIKHPNWTKIITCRKKHTMGHDSELIQKKCKEMTKGKVGMEESVQDENGSEVQGM